ncbi:MAG: DJ-1/PfpI family protein, partial [Hyphomicrobiaceae bacterium]
MKDWGQEIPVDKDLEDIDPEQYHALVIPGGQINPDLLRTNEKAVQLVRKFYETGKPLAAICHGPWLLIEAG